MRGRTLLLTGFEPFDGATENPSADVVRALRGHRLGGAQIEGAVLSCCFGLSLRELRAALRLHRPDVVVALGVAQGRDAITPERIAVNLDDARMPDNAGYAPIETRIVARGPAAYWSTLPVKAIVRDLGHGGIPARLSMTAGTYVCNHVFYGLMHAVRGRPTRAGFIHVPAILDPAQPLSGGLPLAEIERGVKIALRTILRRRHDLDEGRGDYA